MCRFNREQAQVPDVSQNNTTSVAMHRREAASGLWIALGKHTNIPVAHALVISVHSGEGVRRDAHEVPALWR
jgi:hypothetical protein